MVMDTNMRLFKKGVLISALALTLSIFSFAYSNGIHSDDVNHTDYSNKLQIFLDNKYKFIPGDKYKFTIEKQGDVYTVQIQHDTKTIKKEILKATIDNFFLNNAKTAEDEILGIINIPGKK